MKLWLCLLLTYSAQASVMEPDHCLSRPFTSCQIKTQKKAEVFPWQGGQIWLGPNSMVELHEQRVRLLSGQIWLKTKNELPFESSYLQGTVSGDLWVSQEPDRSVLRHLSGDLFLRAKGTQEIITLPVGFQNWYSGIDSQFKVSQGVIRPLLSSETLAKWVQHFRVPLRLARPQWREWSGAWSENVEQSSALYKNAVLRSVAETEERRRQQELAHARRAQEEAGLRRVFR